MRKDGPKGRRERMLAAGGAGCPDSWGSSEVRVFLRCCVLFAALAVATGALVPTTADAHPRRIPRPRHMRHLYPTVDAAREQQAQPDEFAGGEVTANGSPVSYQGGVDGIGVTTGTPRVYLVFWGS